jgi:hypothetical protein
MSLEQLAPSIPAASSNLIVSADAGDEATIKRKGNIDRARFIVSSHMKETPEVKASCERKGPAGTRWMPIRLVVFLGLDHPPATSDLTTLMTFDHSMRVYGSCLEQPISEGGQYDPDRFLRSVNRKKPRTMPGLKFDEVRRD